jgi:hypothetical protein
MLDGTADLAWFHNHIVSPPPWAIDSVDQKRVRELVTALKPERADDYSDWLTVGMIMHKAGLPMDEWDRWSQQSQKYQAGECERRWATFDASGGLGLGTLVQMAKEDGSNPSKVTEQPKQLEFEFITCAELVQGDYTLEYVIENMIVGGQPLIVAGPHKVLKTSLVIDAVVALAVGGLFLGMFRVVRPLRVAVMTGESGFATIRETAMRICVAMGLKLDKIENLFWSQQVPRFGNAEHLAALERLLASQRIEALFIDPVYMAMPGSDAGNLMIQGDLLRGVNEVCQRQGATMVLVHHTKKNPDPKGPPGLEDIAWAGFAEFARQWWLIGRREKYDVGTGEHKLWLSAGGSAGHSGLWAVDVNEGRQDDPGGRRWEVRVQSPDAAAAAGSANRKQKLERDRQMKLFALVGQAESVLKDHPGGLTKTAIRDKAHISSRWIDEVIQTMLDQGRAEPWRVLVGNHKSTTEGYRYPSGRA